MGDFIFALFCIGVFAIFCLILRRYESRIAGNYNATDDEDFHSPQPRPGAPDFYSMIVFDDSNRRHNEYLTEFHKRLREDDYVYFSSVHEDSLLRKYWYNDQNHFPPGQFPNH